MINNICDQLIYFDISINLINFLTLDQIILLQHNTYLFCTFIGYEFSPSC